MAWRNSGVLIRQLLGKRSNPCRCAGLPHHQHRTSSNSIQTLTLTSSPSSPQTIDSLHSPNHLHSLQHQRRLSFAPAAASASAPAPAPASATASATAKATAAASAPAAASGISFSSPTTMPNIMTGTEYERAIKQVKDGLLPAVFCFLTPCYPPSLIRISPIVRKLREKFPHVTIYKVLILQASIGRICCEMRVGLESEPTFHFYLNGEMADEIRGAKADQLIDTFEKLYRYVIPVETTQPTSSSGMGKRRTQQLVVHIKKDEDVNGVKGGRKVASAGTFSPHRGGVVLSQWRGVATLSHDSQQSSCLARAVESSTTAPSLDLVMQAVGYEVGLPVGSEVWWFAYGLFKSQPEKRVMFSKMDRLQKYDWLFYQMAEE